MTLMTNDGYFCLIKEFRKHTEVLGFFVLVFGWGFFIYTL